MRCAGKWVVQAVFFWHFYLLCIILLHPPWNFHYVLVGVKAPTNVNFVETSDLRGSTGSLSREVSFFPIFKFFHPTHFVEA